MIKALSDVENKKIYVYRGVIFFPLSSIKNIKNVINLLEIRLKGKTVYTDIKNFNFENFNKLDNVDNTDLKVYLDFVCELENIKNTIKEKKTDFFILDNPSTERDVKNLELYDVKVEFKKNSAKFLYQKRSLCALFYILYYEIFVILNEIKIQKIELNSENLETIRLCQIIELTRDGTNQMIITFASSIEDEINDTIMVQDNETYGFK